MMTITEKIEYAKSRRAFAAVFEPEQVNKWDTAIRDLEHIHLCAQCGKDMGMEYILGAVCGKCCRLNHRKVMGR